MTLSLLKLSSFHLGRTAAEATTHPIIVQTQVNWPWADPLVRPTSCRSTKCLENTTDTMSRRIYNANSVENLEMWSLWLPSKYLGDSIIRSWRVATKTSLLKTQTQVQEWAPWILTLMKSRNLNCLIFLRARWPPPLLRVQWPTSW
jgi:hypothetical protein